jgi:extracellular elastinolytic metalloproteinase
MRKIFSLLLSLSYVLSFASQDPKLSSIKNHIATELGLEISHVQLQVTSSYTDSKGVQFLYGNQTIDGLPLYKHHFNAAFKNDELQALKNNFINHKKLEVANSVYQYEAYQAVQTLVDDVPINKDLFKKYSNNEWEYVDENISDEPIRVTKLWVLANSQLNVAYQVSVYEKDHLHWYNTVIDGGNLSIYDVIDWVNHCEGFSSLKQSIAGINAVSKGHQTTSAASYNVFAMPLESPNHGNRTVEVDPHNQDASPFGWHDINGSNGAEFTITRGNNVYASEDRNNDNQPGYSPDGGDSLVFNAAFDRTQSAALFTDAAIINLFYWNNIMHDVWYHYGFDEQSGNFQQNNYNNGGRGGDYVFADAQDGSGTNNANFATPPDGLNPRMQMFLWNVGSGGDFFQVNSPASISGKYTSRIAGFGPRLNGTILTEDLVHVIDGTNSPELGCETLTNASALNGKIALVQRGGCRFVEKVKNAQNAGAIAVIVYDNTGGNPITMGGTDASITIPSIMIRRADGITMKDELENGAVNVSLYDSSLSADNVYDSDFDNGVIAHEYGHGISNRLTGGPANSSCLSNQEQMGEGWSDFFALVMTHQPGDKGSDRRGIGTYVRGQSTNGNGIRPYPYSTDLSISPYRYDNIKTFSVPHGVGSVWCSMLWDLYWAMIDKHGYDSDIYEGKGGNNMAMQLVMDGMKLQPCSPGFVDGRDAILLADQINYNGENETLIWEVFARRGLGADANQGSSNSRADGVESFDVPRYLIDRLILDKRSVVQSENGTELSYTIEVINKTSEAIKDVVIRDTLNSNVGLDESTLSCNAQFNNSILTFTLDSIGSNDTFKCSYTVIPRFESTSTVIYSDDVEEGAGNWRIENNNGSGAGTWTRTTNRKYNGEFSWFVDNEASESDYALVQDFIVEGNQPVLAFRHWYNSEENWDGGVVEASLDGVNWVDLGINFMLNGYNSIIQTNPASAISGRDAFTGNSGEFILSKIDLRSYVGDTVSIRFRFVSDAAASAEGWYIDNIELQDAVSLENYITVDYNSFSDRVGVTTFITGEGFVSAGVEKLVKSDVTVYPNPADDFVILQSSSNNKVYAELRDLNGKVLKEVSFTGSATLETADLVPAVYFITLRTTNASESIKLIIH